MFGKYLTQLKTYLMNENETSISLIVDKKLLDEFMNSISCKSKHLGIPLTRKQAMHLAMKEAIDNWKKLINEE